MKRKVLIRLAGLLLLSGLPGFAYCCLSFDSFSATFPSNDHCTANLAWTFEECSETGIYYITYSPDLGANFYIIGTVNSTGATGSASYTYTDSYAHTTGTNTSNTVEYRIVFVVTNTQSTHYSTVSAGTMGTATCSLNNVTRCNSLSGLGFTGPHDLCPPATGNYGLTSAIPTFWSIPSGSGYVTTSTPTFGGNIYLTNSSTSGQYVTLYTNVEGCYPMSYEISLGLPGAGPTIGGAYQGESFCQYSSFNLYPLSNPTGDIEWSTSIGTIVVDPLGAEAYVYLPGGYTSDTDPVDEWLVTARSVNTCGVSNTEVTVAGYIDGCTGGGTGTRAGSPMGTSSAAGLGSSGSLSVYPNPAGNIVNVSLPANVDVTRATIVLADIYGRQLKKLVTVNYNNSINLSGMASGVYLLEIFDGKKPVTVQKVIKR